VAPHAGSVRQIDNRVLARIAKLAGAPASAAAGVDLHVKLGQPVEAGQPLYTLHAEAPGELRYAARYASEHGGVIEIAHD
jgi:thymidine phosphorylase